jgi:hypothetical protein
MKKMVISVMMAALSMLSAADVFITDTGLGTGTTTWTADNVYFLENFVFRELGRYSYYRARNRYQRKIPEQERMQALLS